VHDAEIGEAEPGLEVVAGVVPLRGLDHGDPLLRDAGGQESFSHLPGMPCAIFVSIGNDQET